MAWLASPLVLQGAAMTVDEVVFHRRRGLGAWERLGHPVDTVSVIACLAWILLEPPTAKAQSAYLALAVVSCVLITKDEAVHARSCCAGEQWLHAILFVVHPICLASLWLMWPAIHSVAAQPLVSIPGARAAVVVRAQLALTTAFCIYQVLYWNRLPWLRRAHT
jgi:hypothetical protein